MKSKIARWRPRRDAQQVLQARSDDLYSEFRKHLQKEFKDHGYGWSPAKARSCDWIVRKLPEGGVGVDVGGTAYLVKQAQQSGRDITYFDYFPPQDSAVEKYVVADMADFGNYFEPGSLDFVTTRHTLEHATNPLFQLWQYNRALKEGGTLVVVVPQYAKDWVWFFSHFSVLPQESWLMLFYRAGFAVKEATAGSWKPWNPQFIEYRFVLQVERRGISLDSPKHVVAGRHGRRKPAPAATDA